MKENIQNQQTETETETEIEIEHPHKKRKLEEENNNETTEKSQQYNNENTNNNNNIINNNNNPTLQSSTELPSRNFQFPNDIMQNVICDEIQIQSTIGCSHKIEKPKQQQKTEKASNQINQQATNQTEALKLKFYHDITNPAKTW